MCALFNFSTFLHLHHFLSHQIKFFQHDRLAAHARHEREDERPLWAFVESCGGLSIEHAAAAHAAESHVGLNHADHFEFAEYLLHAIGRIWPDGAQPHETDLQAPIAHVLDCETSRHRVAALHEKD